MSATIKDLVRFAKSTKAVCQTMVGMRGQIDFIDDEWAGANNYDPNSGSKGPIFFNQTNLDAVFGSGVFTPTEFTNIQGAISAIKSAISANAQVLDRLGNITINENL